MQSLEASLSYHPYYPYIPASKIIPINEPTKVQNLAKFSVVNHPATYFKILMIVPIVIELLVFMNRVWKNPGMMKRNCIALKNQLVGAVTRREGEESGVFHRRVLGNVTKVAIGMIVVAGVIVVPILFFPILYAIPTAIIIILTLGKLYQDRGAYTEKISSVVNWFKTAFIRKEGEEVFEAWRRVCKNICIVTGGVLLLAAAILISIYAGHLIAAASSPFNIVKKLPFQIPPVVFLEYFALSSLHFGRAYKKWKEGEKGYAIFHVLCGILGILFPFANMKFAPHDFRIHHIFLGLVIMLFPMRGMQFLGGMITADSYLYALSPKRGNYTVDPIDKWGRGGFTFHSYDLVNVIFQYLPILLFVYALVIAFQYTVNKFVKKKEIEDEKTMQSLQAQQDSEKELAEDPCDAPENLSLVQQGQ